MLDFKPAITEITEELIEFRHDLHAHPEGGYEERRTAARVATELSKLPNLRITAAIGGTGVMAVLNAHRGSPCVALRADLDALPLEEKTGLPYASQTPGMMHACGHDGHTACLVGAARVLHAFAEQLPGAVKFVFQPAEEGGAGARKMIEAGVLDGPRVDAAFALHGWPDLDLGRVAVAPGPVLAGARAFEVTMTGHGTHAAYPHKGSDVILAALVNDAACAELVAEVASEVVGSANVDRTGRPRMGAEDFAFFAQAVPSAWYRLGLRPAGVADMPPLHNPHFDFTDAAIPLGVHLHCALTYRFVTSPPVWKCG
ncbi:MAG: M20 family metallopeptidase [Planctomycetota bacterium]